MSSNADYAAVLPLRTVYFDMLVIESLFYGVYVALFLVTAYTIFSRHQIHFNVIGLHIAILLLFIFSTIHLATKWTIVRNAYVFNGDTPLTTVDYLSAPPFSIEILESTVFSTSTFIADSILVWRTWIIWGRDARVAAIPALATIAGAILGYLSIAQEGRFLLNKPIKSDAYVEFSTPYFYLSLGTTVLCTVLIILRIVLMSRGAKGRLRSYRSAIEMIVESAALYSITLIGFIATGMLNIQDGYPQAMLGPMTGIAPTLIVCRVALGLSRPDPTWHTRTNATAVRFNRSEASDHTGRSDTVFTLSTLEPTAEGKV
ncbi:hypothetical protein MIND_00761900 [Mycena indigotica]|uniref:Uncharacterized protein n=1 Tax=Mycena indigotica TaxID=2126181 RepID=A0A8H6SMW8_9AGAR|nr:uncharacterized protein MIND_00761900 [Mycena indigotica]KAF7301958.1 hypothetical protein MIND_00761900 [Mycena indigotica]